MRILVLASRKGGSGKTTIAAHVAVEAERSGAGPVAVIDTDSQGSLAAWWNVRAAHTPLFAAVDIGQLADHLTALRSQGIKLVVIDTPPALIDMIRGVLSVANVVLIPARPSPHDLRAVANTVEMVEEADKHLVFVINGATPRTNIAADAVRVLAQHGRVAPVTIHQRIDFAASMIDGRTVGELNPQSRSAQEIADLWKYVKTQLSKCVKGR